MAQTISVFWFRRDLRLVDNACLYKALSSGSPVLPIFIFDKNILDDLKDKKDKRVHFIHRALGGIKDELEKLGSTLSVFYDTPLEAFRQLIETYTIETVYINQDYEPYAQKRDTEIAQFLKERGIGFYTQKDHVIFEKAEVVKDDKTPYTVFTPYSKKWKEKLNDTFLKPFPCENFLYNLLKLLPCHFPTLIEIGFIEALNENIPYLLNERVAENYHNTRDYPSLNGTTRLSVHLRFGTISIRKLVSQVKEMNDTLLNELIWREFYQMILWHFPHVVGQSFKQKYDNIQWVNNENDFRCWCEGKTGYPIVDAGMRQLNETGYMHNRVRMITASFLTKHLLTDWRWGEAYFAEKLLDYDLAANNGGWQWAAGSGCDAAPYFRIFNPYLQTKKFDADLKYIKQWIPDYNSQTYIQPIVEHVFATQRCLAEYKKALSLG